MKGRHLTLVAGGPDRAPGPPPARPDALLIHVVGGVADAARAAGMATAVAGTGAFAQRVLDAAPGRAAADVLAELAPPADVRRAELPAGSDARRLGGLLEAVDAELADAAPAAVVVYGDGDAALAGALAAARRRLALVRLGGAAADGRTSALVQRLADVLLVHDEDDAIALVGRAINPERIWVVGDPLTDVLRHAGRDLAARGIWRRTGVAPGRYVLAVLSDPAAPPALALALAERRPLLVELGADLAMAWKGAGALEPLRAAAAAPLAGLSLAERLSLVRSAGVLVTDSPLLRDAAGLLGVPCAADADVLPARSARPASARSARAGARCAEALVANFARVRPWARV